MADEVSRKPVDKAAAVVGLCLLALAGVIVWDARRLTITSVYGMGPEAVPYLIAGGLALLAVSHFFVAVRSALPEREAGDPRAILWIGLGLVGLIGAIGLGIGFIPAMALLFAATARAFGRTAFATDLVIGLALGLVTYLMFTKLLTLSLPEGPLERFL
ncbi:MAG TPA: tripartite tricarboxylate transporter TctB family protein [Beijerinckiaceae bacterium]|nr:tripartite tricarboxylate transporter TctB family protein [Beijerinckiaceae bacterium]